MGPDGTEQLARRQHRVVAVWQLARMQMPREEIRATTRGLRRVHRGVVALGDITEHGWLMAAALALGPQASVSRHSALALWALRAPKPGDIDVTVPGRSGRADREGISIHRPRGRFRQTVELQRRIKGRTRSDSEAAFVLLCDEHRLKLPLVNHRLNGCETDFHWPQARLVVEVDGYDHHKERPQFEEDRRRGIRHRANGYEVVRLSANQVYDEAGAVVRALLSAAPSLALAE